MHANSPTAHVSPLTRMSQTGHLSPISTGMEVHNPTIDSHGSQSRPSTSSAAPTTAMSLTSVSSSLDAWAMGFGQDDDANESVDHRMCWAQSPEEVQEAPPDSQPQPKMEEDEDEDFCMNDVTEAPITPVASSNATTPSKVKIKRPRGRPRKHPLPLPNASKVTKGRSKTGCITCRKRKKKCDEAKPRCEYYAATSPGVPQSHTTSAH